MKEFEKAKDDFQRVIQLYPSNKAAKSQVSLRVVVKFREWRRWLVSISKEPFVNPSQVTMCQKRIKEQHEKDKRIYANMFQKFAERDSKVWQVQAVLIVVLNKRQVQVSLKTEGIEGKWWRHIFLNS